MSNKLNNEELKFIMDKAFIRLLKEENLYSKYMKKHKEIMKNNNLTNLDLKYVLRSYTFSHGLCNTYKKWDEFNSFLSYYNFNESINLFKSKIRFKKIKYNFYDIKKNIKIINKKIKEDAISLKNNFTFEMGLLLFTILVMLAPIVVYFIILLNS